MKAQIVDGPFRKANYPVFPTLVQVYNLQDNPSNIEIINYIDEQELTEWPKDIGDGASTSQNEMNILDNFDIKKDIENCVNEYCIDVGLERLEIGKSWINVQRQKGYIASHRHELSIISGAYYPFVEPNSSPLVFGSPILGPKMSEIHNQATEYTANEMEVDVRTGFLVLFPSWLYHYTIPNPSLKRVTLSFNTYHKTLDK